MPEKQESDSLEKLHIDGAPAIVAHTAPFRLILRTKEDTWNPTIEDINNHTYDYIKLHRLSASLDVGLPPPMHMYITFDGSLLLPKIPDVWPLEKAIATFNRNLGYMVLGGVYFAPIAPADIDQGVLYPATGYYRTFGLASGYQSQLRQTLQSKMASPLHSILLYKPRHILASDVHSAHEKGKEICNQILSLSPEFLVHGVFAFVSNDWSASLSHLWVNVEQIVEHLWNKHIVDKEIDHFIEGRHKFLNDHRTWTTSTKIELLFQKGNIPGATYALLNAARKARNTLVHTGKFPPRDVAQAALEGTFQLIACSIGKEINTFDPILKKFKELDQIQRHYEKPKPIVDKNAQFWIGPIPPIPGEKEWGNRPFETIWDMVGKEKDKSKT